MSGWRQPLPLVLCDGNQLPGVFGFSVTETSNLGANVWSLKAAISADPGGLAAWDARTASVFDIRIGLNGSWTSLITGQADTVIVNTTEGTLYAEGRDLTARFIGARTNEAFVNQTSSDVASLLAARQGLSAQVTQTTTPIGRYFGNEHDRVTLDRYTQASNEWDLLVWLAQIEEFDVYVNGTTLVFTPPPQSSAPLLTLASAMTGPVAPNVKSMRFERAFTLSGPIDVSVKSWNSQSQAGFQQTASSAGNGQGAQSSYVYIRPNINAGEASRIATQKLTAILSHQYVMTAELPGEVDLTSQDKVAVVGTNSSFDQTYDVEEIIRTFDMKQGFNERIRARSAGS